MGLRHITLGDIFRRNAQLFPGRTAIVCGFERISHSDFLKRAERLAAGLAAQGVKPGDRVAVAARNCLEFTDLYGATALIGAIMLPVNWRLNADEIAYVLTDGAPTLLIVGPEDQPTIAGMHEKLPASTRYFGIGSAAAPFRPFAELTGAGTSPPAVEVDLYFGLATRQGEVTAADWSAFLAEEVTPRFPDGLSVVDIYGQWQGKNETTPERLRTKMLVIDYPDTPENRARIDAIRSAWRQKTGDQSVMRVTEPADVSF